MRGEISLPSPPGWHRGLELLENVIYWGKNNPKWIRGSDHGQVSHRKCPRLGLEPLEGLPDHGKGGTGSALRSLPTPPILGLCRSRTLPIPGFYFCCCPGLWINHSDSEHATSSRNHFFFCCWTISAPNSLPGHQTSPSRGTYSPLETSPEILLPVTDFRPWFQRNLNFHMDFLDSRLHFYLSCRFELQMKNSTAVLGNVVICM